MGGSFPLGKGGLEWTKMKICIQGLWALALYKCFQYWMASTGSKMKGKKEKTSLIKHEQ